MRVAVISDIHGNAEALDAVLDDIDYVGADFSVCLGDVVGYYPDPEYCVDVIRDRAVYTVCGNHDRAVTGGIPTDNFNEHAEAALYWTETRLSVESKLFLASLPPLIRIEGMVFAHASPNSPESFRYLFDNDRRALSEAFSELVCRAGFVGHTHCPFIAMRHDGGISILPHGKPVNIEDGNYYLINVGSVGQPRDLDPRAAWFLFDTDAKRMELFRVAYDWRITQRKIIAAGLPTFLSDRLAKGI